MATTGTRLSEGIWKLSDPKISLASIASMFLGACAAAAAGPLDPVWLAVTVAGILCVEAAKNASGEIHDFDSGTDLAVEEKDRSPFSGGKRVLVEGILTRRQTGWIAVVGYALFLAAGVAIVVLREPRVLWLGIAGGALAYLYNGPPLYLSYRGWGETVVALCYGPAIAAGTFLVQRGDVSLQLILLSIPLGMLIASFLWINEFPDLRADASAGKRTLVVRLGRRKSVHGFLALVLVGGLSPAVLVVAGAVPAWASLGSLSLLPGLIAWHLLQRHPDDTPRIIPAQALTLIAFLVLSLGSGLGLLL
ncbi:MAG: prenyltransferase [Planctomycetota bacterium]|jgi:1,4-dihydroxy-2-naphthoate octaprenyltransferase